MRCAFSKRLPLSTPRDLPPLREPPLTFTNARLRRGGCPYSESRFVPSPVLSLGHFSPALLGHFCKAPTEPNAHSYTITSIPADGSRFLAGTNTSPAPPRLHRRSRAAHESARVQIPGLLRTQIALVPPDDGFPQPLRLPPLPCAKFLSLDRGPTPRSIVICIRLAVLVHCQASQGQAQI
jgi:hypothetical protein